MFGIEIYASPHLTVQKNVARSPSRALRRWRKGIRKVTPFADVPAPHALRMPGGQMVMHPAMLDRLRREMDVVTGERRMRSILDDWHRAVRPQFGIFGDMSS